MCGDKSANVHQQMGINNNPSTLRELEYRRTLAPVLLGLAFPVVAAIDVNNVVGSLLLLLVEPHRLVGRIWTAFGCGSLGFSFALTSSLSLLLFESTI